MSSTGGAKGTLAWKAPELFEEDDNGDFPDHTLASDIFRSVRMSMIVF